VLAIATGLAEVLPDAVTVLSRIAELAEDIDVSRAEAARKRAEERLAGKAGDLDYARARTALDKAILRVQVASRARGR
jgi:F-type H+-transporting ATPase subunit epsilon